MRDQDGWSAVFIAGLSWRGRRTLGPRQSDGRRHQMGVCRAAGRGGARQEADRSYPGDRDSFRSARARPEAPTRPRDLAQTRSSAIHLRSSGGSASMILWPSISRSCAPPSRLAPPRPEKGPGADRGTSRRLHRQGRARRHARQSGQCEADRGDRSLEAQGRRPSALPPHRDRRRSGCVPEAQGRAPRLRGAPRSMRRCS